MLQTWLDTSSVEKLRAANLELSPTARPGSALAMRELLTWDVLDRVLRQQPDALVVAHGKLLEEPAPRSLDELKPMLARGVGLCVRHTERHDDGLAHLASTFAALGPAQVQVFVTPRGTYGFGWHYDDEDVFIAQTAGRKDYYFRRNSVVPNEPARPAMFAQYRQETSPLYASTLVTGDSLYIPSRWWHMAVCSEDALSISVGARIRARAHSPASSAASCEA